MNVSVDTIVSQRDFGVIFSGTVVEPGHAMKGERLRFRAANRCLPGEVGVGETWTIHGEGRDTPYGHQVEVVHARRVLTGGHLVQRFLANHVPGVGEERARRLWSVFGDQLTEVLADDDRLGDVAEAMVPGKPVLSARLAALTIRMWREAAGEAAVMAWLDGIGLDDFRLARRLYRLCGDRTSELLEANPYVLVPLVPWQTLDKIGQVVLRKTAADVALDRRRLVGAVDESIKRVLATGSTAVADDDLDLVLERLLGTSDPVVIGDAVAYAEQAGAVVRDGRLLRAPGAAAMETALQGHLRRLLRAGPAHTSGAVRKALLSVEGELQPHAQQAEAVISVLSSPVACLVGGAGTGKTFTCRLVVDVWEALGGNVLPCALAGKAALRLSRSTGRLAKTMARTLAELDERDRIVEGGDTDAKGTAKLGTLASIGPGTLVLIDEASMVDLPAMHALVRRMPEGSHLLLVGDEAQLPPVGFGVVFHRLVWDTAITFRLTHVHRQAASTGIPAIAANVRERVLPDLGNYQGAVDGVSHLVADNQDGTMMDKICQTAIDLGAVGGEALIVTATNSGAYGVDEINAEMQRRRFSSSNVPAMRGYLGKIFGIGDPVIFGRNDYAAGLVNGLMGVVTEIFPEAMAIEVAFDGEVRRSLLEGEQLLDLSLAYAVTCHKCQGSSARRIVVPLYKSRVLDPSWLYTAITRAERQVVLVGPLEHADAALAKPYAADVRKIGFRWEDGG